jgi:hypothetical protein
MNPGMTEKKDRMLCSRKRCAAATEDMSGSNFFVVVNKDDTPDSVLFGPRRTSTAKGIDCDDIDERS